MSCPGMLKVQWLIDALLKDPKVSKADKITLAAQRDILPSLVRNIDEQPLIPSPDPRDHGGNQG